MAIRGQALAPIRFAAAVLVACAAGGMTLATPATVAAVVPVVQTYSDGTDDDQDDMCIWIHPTDPSRSTIVSADKGNGTIYVYDLDGAVIQTLASPKPGNIDVRYGFQLGVDCVDLVAFNDRDEDLIRVYKVDPDSRMLERVDDGDIATPGGNYGFTLYRHADGRLFAYTGPKGAGSVVSQYALFDDGSGRVAGVATGWRFDESTVEGMAGDDETGYVYLGEESVGVWRVHALDETDKTLIAAVGDASGLAADVEGVTLYHAAAGAGYIIASSQGDDKFTVLERRPPHAPVGEFTLAGVGSTDGIDVVNLDLGPRFPRGIFTAHNGDDCCPVEAARWDEIVAEVGGMVIDARSWDPRSAAAHCVGSATTTTGTTTTTMVSATTTTLGKPDGCAAAPRPSASCRDTATRGSRILVDAGAAARLRWTWKRGEETSLASLGDPVEENGSYRLCVYDGSAAGGARMQVVLRTGAACGASPCWRRRGSRGLRYRDRAALPDGVRSAKLTAGAVGKARVMLEARAPNLPSMGLVPGGVELPVTVQLVIGSGSGAECWQSVFTLADQNDERRFKARGP